MPVLEPAVLMALASVISALAALVRALRRKP